jgi:hypothetical protein
MATTPATEESVIFAACISAAAEIHKGEVVGDGGGKERLARLAIEYYEEAMAVRVAGDD